MKKSLITFGILATCGLIALVIALEVDWAALSKEVVDQREAILGPTDPAATVSPQEAADRLKKAEEDVNAYKEYQHQGGTLDLEAWVQKQGK